MSILVLGVNHLSAPVEVRERLAFTPASLGKALRRARALPDIDECCILSTCNRTEVYCTTEQIAQARAALVEFLCQFHGMDEATVLSCLYEHVDMDAAAHLFCVASGVDSLVLGESEIVGQVHGALESAEGERCAGPVLHALFREALRVGKLVRDRTEIGRGALSVASVAVQLAKQIFGELGGRTVLLVGAGKTSELTARNLARSGAATVIVANRTYENAVRLAEVLEGKAVRFEHLGEELENADVVISSTAAPHTVLDREMVRQAMKARRGRPLFLIDIAVPRDIDPAVGDLSDVYLYNIDDLATVVQENYQQRQREAAQVLGLVDEAVQGFLHWLRGRGAVPLIISLRERAEQARMEEVRWALGKLGHTSDRERAVIEALSNRLVNKLLAQPLAALKEFAEASDAEYRLTLARRLFALQEEGQAAREVEKDGGRE